MSTIKLADLYKEMFTSPLEAVCESEKNYRSIWASWIKSQKEFFRNSDGEYDSEAISNLLNQSPVIELDGALDINITVRIAKIEQKEGGLSGGISVGPIHASGKYGFANESKEESTFSASTRFTISNHNSNLNEFLIDRNIKPKNEQDLDKLVEDLENVES